MSRITRYFCDECHKEIPRVEVQWPALAENGWRYFDFCGYPCAEKCRARVLAERANDAAVSP